MTTSGSRPSNHTENTFSYAAAASGKNSVGSANKSQSAISTHSTVPSSGSTVTQRPASSASSSTAHNMNGSTAPTTRTSTPQSIAMSDSRPKQNPEAPSASSASSPRLGASSSVVPKEDGSLSTALPVPEDKANSWEKQSQTSSHADNKSSSGSRTPDVSRGGDLVPASIPPVNPWKVRSENIARKSSAPPPAVPALPKLMTGPSTTAPKANNEKPTERGLATGKEILANVLSEAQEKEKEKEKVEEVSSAIGDRKDSQVKDRRKGGEATKINGFAGSDGGAPRKSGKKSQQREGEPTAPALPPPVTDTESWPTPETAQDEAEKVKKERVDKEKATAPVTRGNKWVMAEIVPEYVTSYKVPRGGRSNRPAREGGSRGGGTSYQAGERGVIGSGAGVGSENERGRQGAGVGAPRGGYQAGKGGKRATSAGGNPQRRDSKVALPAPAGDKRREFVKDGAEPNSGSGQPTKPPGVQDDRQLSSPVAMTSDQEGNSAQAEPRQSSEGQDRNHQNGQNFHQSSERGSYRSFNSRSDHTPMEGASSHPPRERGIESRGRGGYRGGRGGNFYGSQYSNNHHNNGGHHAGSNTNYNSTPQHFNQGHANGQYSSQGSQSSGRTYRGSARTHSLPNTAAAFNRFPNPHMQPPSFSPYQVSYGYEMMAQGEAQMVPIPFPLLTEITNQINYYFSVDNLCKDMFLRKHMDNEGFVALSFIAKFNRVRILTQDIITLRDACIQSQDLYLVPGSDDWYIRKAESWETWTLAEEDRDPSARGSRVWSANPPHGLQNGIPGEMSGSAPPFNPDPRRNRSLGTIAVSAPPFIPSGGYPQSAGGMSSYGTPLSADVPEFSPSFVNMNGLPGVFAPHPLDQEFPDSDVDQLIIVVKRPAVDSKPSSPEASPSKSRTNGTGSPVFTNGDVSGHDSSLISPSSAVFPGNLGDRSMNAQGDVGWLLSQDIQGSPESQNLPPKKLVHRFYGQFLLQTLNQRKENARPIKNSDMVTLYRFWSHFLPQKYNARMYSDFRKYALEDANNSLRSGLENLFNFYESSFNCRENLSNDLVQDFIQLARADAKNGFEYGLQKVRAVLGSDNLREHHRQSIEGLLDAEMGGFLGGGVEKKDGQLVELHLPHFSSVLKKSLPM